MRCLVEPAHAAQTVQEQPARACIDAVIDVLPSDTTSGCKGTLQLQSGKRLGFDYCILCCGSDYAMPIKAAQSMQASVRERQLDYQRSHSNLAAARSILVVGAGDVGVELAAEIVGKWPSGKLVSVVTSQSRGERTAFAAELSAGLAARNVMRLASGQPLLRFPEDACHGARRLPKIAAVSLYKSDGVLQFNRLVLCGFPAVVTKWLVEYLQVRAARGSWLHTIAWDCFEAVGVWLGAHLFC
ncbi:hypothetical protein WJX81_000294 [Elliptochloris bilobata]|uniref:FAD/NAD(P)-binding domain-containing protein n=1 Tax=Elliptochloris bilobata TaxID=381761 RepID=A0AAW1QL33_9CHLO